MNHQKTWRFSSLLQHSLQCDIFFAHNPVLIPLKCIIFYNMAAFLGKQFIDKQLINKLKHLLTNYACTKAPIN